MGDGQWQLSFVMAFKPLLLIGMLIYHILEQCAVPHPSWILEPRLSCISVR